MDFGALQCTPVAPPCAICPLAASCAALATGRVDSLPVREKGAAVQTRRFDYVYVRFRGRTAIRRRGPGDIWQGLYEPLVNDQRLKSDAHDGGGIPRNPLGRCAPTAFDQRLKGATLLKSNVKHQLTHRTLLVDFYLWEPTEEPALPEGYIWIDEAELDRYAKPRLFELLLEALP